MKKPMKIKAQSITEYGICVAIVILATIAMQAYVRRGLQGRYVDVIGVATKTAKASPQYEPYYIDFQEGTETQGIVQSRKINTDFQPGGKLTTDILEEKNDVPLRVKTEGINCYADKK